MVCAIKTAIGAYDLAYFDPRPYFLGLFFVLFPPSTASPTGLLFQVFRPSESLDILDHSCLSDLLQPSALQRLQRF